MKYALCLLLLLVSFPVLAEEPDGFMTMDQMSCAGVGESVGGRSGAITCCKTLTAMGGWPGGYEGRCNAASPPTGSWTCAPCGNGICDAEHGENKCNCPSDCEKPVTEE